MIANGFVEEAPFVTCAVAQLKLKEEDVPIIYEPSKEPDADPDAVPWHLVAVCDGHQGSAAAKFVEAHLWEHLAPGLPKSFPAEWEGKELEAFAEGVRKALISAVDKVDTEWYRTEMPSGTTATVALVGGWLLSVANVGDSLSILHTGHKVVEMTRNHRLDNCPEEQQRLRDNGVQLAALDGLLEGPAGENELGVGPLRAWPGGLAVSRSVGDADVSPFVVALPHVRQIMVPPEGARYLVASDGLWDRLTAQKVYRATRSKSLHKLPSYLLSLVERASSGVLRDDTTVIAVDILPIPGADFKRLVADRRRSNSRYPRLAFLCGGPIVVDDLGSLLADVDGLDGRAGAVLQRKDTISFDPDKAPETFRKRKGDYTVHGGAENDPANGAAKGLPPKPPKKVNALSSALPLWLVREARAGSA